MPASGMKWIEVVEAAGEEVHVYAGHFVARIADVHRAVKRRRVLFPLLSEPGFYLAVAADQCLLEGLQGLRIGGGNFWERHGGFLSGAG